MVFQCKSIIRAYVASLKYLLILDIDQCYSLHGFLSFFPIGQKYQIILLLEFQCLFCVIFDNFDQIRIKRGIIEPMFLLTILLVII